MESEATTKEEDGIESQIERSMRSRLQHFMEQADSLTFAGVRRLLEKDLGLETYALDVHKRFIKQLFEKHLNAADDGNVCKTSGVTVEENVSLIKTEEAESPEKHRTKNDLKEQVSGDEQKTEDSPVMGLLTGNKLTKSMQAQGIKRNEAPSEGTIKKAIQKKASYLIANSEKITMAGVRRLLEKDLELDKNALDPFKTFISKQLDEVINSPKVSKSVSGGKKKSSETSQSKISRSVSCEKSESSDGESDQIDDEVKSKKKVSPKGKIQNFEGLKKRKRPEKETKVSSKMQIKRANMASEENSDAEDGGNVSEDNQSRSSSEKAVKKKEVSTPAYGKRVEHLKSIIKSCGMSVAPSIYKKAKQVSDNKREDFLIRELQAILSREGLSTNPTEKEIKDVRKRKQREKELEGIDMSNIVSSSRRRSTTSFVAPPKPKSPVKSDGADSGTDNEDGDEDDDDEDDGDNDVDDGDESQSDELNEDADDSD